MIRFLRAIASWVEWLVIAFACLTAIGVWPGMSIAAATDRIEMNRIDADLVAIELAADLQRLTRRVVIPLPEIVWVSDLEIFELCRCNSRALFVAGGVRLRRDVDLATGEGKAVLVHELVHGIQHREHGPATDCADWLDREAEALLFERLWRGQHGVRLPPPPRYQCKEWR